MKYPTLPRLNSGRFRGVMMLGHPGIGKSYMARRVLPDVDPKHIVSLSLPCYMPEAFGTIPVPREIENGAFIIENPIAESRIVPLLEENIGDGRGVLILDDLTVSAQSEALQSALLSLVQFGEIGSKTLGKNVAVVLTGNLPSSQCFAVPVSKALMGRCVVIESKADFKQWQKVQNHVVESVVAFLTDFENNFAPEPTCKKTVDALGRQPSARAWTDFMSDFAQREFLFEPDILFASFEDYVSAYVGSTVGISYATYHREFSVYPRAQDLYDDAAIWDKVPSEKQKALSGAWAVAFGLNNHVMKLVLSGIEPIESIKNQYFRALMAIAKHNKELIASSISALVDWGVENSSAFTALICQEVSENTVLFDENIHAYFSELSQAAASTPLKAA
jgi:hypothetical protein